MRNDLAPFIPTQMHIVKKMLEIVQVNRDDVVFDLGCGDGRILFAAVKDFGAKKAVGYELRRDLYDGVLQEIQKQNLEDRIVVFNDNLLNANLSEATVITLYLTTSANNDLKSKIRNGAKPGTRIVSNRFEFGGWSYSKKEEIKWHTLYLYTIPEAFRNKRKNHSFFSNILESIKFKSNMTHQSFYTHLLEESGWVAHPQEGLIRMAIRKVSN